MFKYDNIEYRNLQEQVLENKEEIARHWNVDRVLADFGITVLGRLDTVEELENIDEGENWGYGYLVGLEAPYDVYVWTRPNLNVGEPNAYWLNIGKISIVGPQGPQGEPGPQGPAGVGITSIVQNADYTLTITYGDGTQYITRSIRGVTGATGPKGPQGEQGEQGLRGPQGVPGPVGTINIKGTLTDASQLPTASTANIGDAYLVGEIDAYDFYVLVGTAPENYEWVDMGLAGGGTIITVGGSAVGTFDADTKRTIITSPNQVYTTDNSGNQISVGWAVNPSIGGIARFDDTACLRTATPSRNDHAANKKYVDDLYEDTIHGLKPVNGNYCVIWDGDTGKYVLRRLAYYAGVISNGNIAMYMAKSYTTNTEPTGILLMGNPTHKYHAANKNYVDTTYTHAITIKGTNAYVRFNITNRVAEPYTGIDTLPTFSSIGLGSYQVGNNYAVIDRTNKSAEGSITIDVSQVSGITDTETVGFSEVFPDGTYEFLDTVYANN